MKALVKCKPEKGLWLEEVPTPVVGPHDLLIKVKWTSICGTDVHIYNWDEWAQKNVPVPLVIGHEFMGSVVEVGKHVEGVSPGQRVSAEGHLVCGRCLNCLKGLRHLCVHTRGIGYHKPGCFAEYISIPATNAFPLPDTIPDKIGSILDPYGNAVHTALSQSLVGEDVLITGAGPIGIMAAAVAKKAGARRVVVTDVNPYRLKLARKMGATQTINTAEKSLSDFIEEGFSVGLEMSGTPDAFSELLFAMRPGGHVALLGILPPDTTIDWDLVIFKMLKIKGIWGREIFSTWFQMLHLIEGGLDLTPTLTHEFPADAFQKGFDVLFSGQCCKVLLRW